jgi:hypothetical protein
LPSETDLSVRSRQGRKCTARKLAVGSARPDPEARHVTIEMVKASLNQPNMSDEVAERLLDHMYLVADVAVDAFIERAGHSLSVLTDEADSVVASPDQLLKSLTVA